MRKPSRNGRRRGQPRSLDGLVYCLVVLAVFLGVLAAWKRSSQKAGAERADVAEKKLEGALSKLGIPEGWVQIGGPVRNTAAARDCFVCGQCQSTCWTYPGRGRPACPFCGLAMARRDLDERGAGFSLVGGGGRWLGTWPIIIQAGVACPHAERGPCTNCHTIVRPGTYSAGQTPAGTVQSNPQATWQGVAAPAIPAGADKPTLIKEFGMEVCPAGGAGVKVTGVMGNSYASSAGLAAGDIIIECNGAVVRNVAQLQRWASVAAPETNAQLRIIRNGRTRDLAIMVGEGEMEGFLPIRQP